MWPRCARVTVPITSRWVPLIVGALHAALEAGGRALEEREAAERPPVLDGEGRLLALEGLGDRRLVVGEDVDRERLALGDRRASGSPRWIAINSVGGSSETWHMALTVRPNMVPPASWW